MDPKLNAVIEERAYFLSVIKTFKNYREQSLVRIERREKCIETLPQHHQDWLNTYQQDLNKVKECLEKNHEFIPLVLKYAHYVFDGMYSSIEGVHSDPEVRVLSEGLDKVQSVFKQIMRDWSSLGATEREQCYDPVIAEIDLNYPEDRFDRTAVHVLVPGAGLGRLAFEIASRGFTCQGNEFNLFMLIVSYYIINLCQTVNEYMVYPWIHQYSNNHSIEDQLLSVRFPDVTPTVMPDGQFSMTAGDFLEVYTNPNEWHCVATCFFIDCAANIVQFVETIYHILKPGGLWMNIGPLLYHYADMKNEKSIEPSFEVLCQVVKKVGFVMEKSKTGVKTKYCQNPKSMLQYEYNSVFFVCRKPEELPTNGELHHETE